MFDLGSKKIDINCPDCNHKHEVSLQQVANGTTVKCNCGTTIKLHDQGGSAKRGINDINASMKKLQDIFKKLGK